MRSFLLAVGASTLLFFAAPVAAYAAATGADETAVATLTVTGSGQISRPPDLATVAVTIVTNDDDAARALSENNRRFAALSAKLATNGIAPGDVVSTSLNSYFNPRPAAAAPPIAGQVYGFIVTRNVDVKVAALAATGSVIDAATAAGATQINGVSYGFRDRAAVERAALAAAVGDAQAQAQTIAGAAHVRLVRILHIGDEAGAPRRVMPLAVSAMRAKEENVPTTIAPSDLDVTRTISVTYVIR